ncbi:ring finger and transmembrane domain-containing protein 2-like [Stylonychia lemnae]|uniref:Ring finger and transmembrane domain-containing protein 2-like n=1 Tax=Stylonychia lemnae TaxID=5949 RepID=A0A078API4_STYLE|nr:ring finger and transmembrane domain-containing protein 2-like [Stylonychia lemnae]|eukprot:CDW84280.1 ring finger and transmembrane domain-containing protein 2-like [Stylonychia lemnae]
MGANWTSPSLIDLIDSYTFLDGHNNIPDLLSNFDNYSQLEEYIQESFSIFNQNIVDLNEKFGISEINVVTVMNSQNKLSKVLKQRFFKKFLKHIEICITFAEQEFLCEQRKHDLKSISRYIEDEERDLCPICDDKDSDILLVCMHVFCEQCITDWYLRNGSCPMCRIEAGLDNYLMVKPVEMSLLRTVLKD